LFTSEKGVLQEFSNVEDVFGVGHLSNFNQ
jgi:hypothetical protein